MRLATGTEARAVFLVGALVLGGGCSGNGASSGGTGGSPSGSGGATSGTGGIASGSGGTNVGSGGVSGASGGRGGGAGATSSGGTTGTGAGGSAAGSTGATPSAGCGQATTLQSGTATIDVSGTSRTYILSIPSNYDSSKPYKPIFGFHWLGGSATDVASGTIIGGPYYGLQSRSAGSAILVAPDGLPDPNQNNSKGWPNTNGQDIAFVKAMLQLFESNLCIDQSRIFSTGFSYGGIFSLTLGCQMSNVFRAIAPESGEFFGSCTASGAGPVAVWQSQGDSDTTVPPANAQSANNYFVTKNHCSTQTTAVSPSPCVAYQGCDSGYPVTWCEFSGGHMPWSQAPDPVWAFFNQF
jgi:polyhydroxybutyrate depolymerase